MFPFRRRPACPWHADAEEDRPHESAPETVITLVHGTWAQHAWVKPIRRRQGAWYERDLLEKLDKPEASEEEVGPKAERLYDGLSRRLPDAAIHRFCWSGGNSHSKRMEGGSQLRSHLEDLLERFPGSRHFVVAHSHGGTVALYALLRNGLSDRVAGVVTLATPFLHFNRRKLPGFLRLWIGAGVALALAVMVAGAVGIGDGGRVAEIVDYPSFWWWVSTVAVALAVLSVVSFVVSSFFYRRGEFGPMSVFGLRDESEVADELKRLSLPDIGEGKLHAVLALGDEAAGALVTSQFLFSRVVTAFLRLLDPKGLLFAWRNLVGAAFVVSYAVGLSSPTGDFLSNLVVAVLWALALGTAGVAILGLVILALGSLPFGWDAGFLTLFVQTTAERLPAGRAGVFQLGVAANSGLAHSIQTRPDVHDEVVSWIKSA